MSRRTPIEELVDEESGVDTPSRRRSSRIAAVVTRRTSTSDDIPATITKSTRLSLSQETNLEKDDPKSSAPSTPPRKRITRGASKSPSTISKIEEGKNVPATRLRRIASTSSIMDEEDRAASPALSKVTTRRRSVRSQSTSPTSEAAGNSKPSTPRKSSRAVSASPTSDLTKSAPPKLRGRRPSVTEKIIPLEAIEETEPKIEEASASKDETPNEEEKTEEISDENLPFKKKKVAALKKQNLQSIEEKITEENEEIIVVDKPEGQEKDAEEKEESSGSDKNKKPSPTKSTDSGIVLEHVQAEEKKTLKRDSTSSDTPETAPKTPKYSLSLKTKTSPGESMEEKELKAVLNVDKEKAVLNVDKEKEEVPISPRRSPRLSTSNSGSPDKSKQTNSDVLNITGGVSDESFQLKLNLSQFDSSQGSIEQKKPEEKSPENGMNTSGSGSTSDKENQAKVTELKEKKLVVSIENMDLEKKNSPLVEKISTPETSKNEQKPQRRKSSFYEAMEVEDYPSDYEYSILEKADESTKKLTTSAESPMSPIISTKSPKVLNRSLADKSPKIMETSTDKSKLLEPSSVEQDSNDGNKETLSPLTKLTSGVSEKIDVALVKAHSLPTEVAKPCSPQRRSARLLNQSKSDSPEENQNNSSPKQKSSKSSEDLDTNMEIGDETTISVDIFDDEPFADNDSKKDELVIDEDEEVNISSKSSNLNTSGGQKENQNKSIIVEDKKNKSKNASTILDLDTEEEDDTNDDDPKFSEGSDSEITKPNQSKTNTSLKKDSFRDEAKSNGDDGNTSKKDLSKRDSILKNKSKNEDEEIVYSLESDSEDIPIKDSSKKDSPLKTKSPGRNSSGQRKSTNDQDIDEKHQSRRDSFRRTSKGKDMEERKSFSNKKDDDLDFSEDSDCNEDKKESSFKRTSISNKKDEEPNFSENSDSENNKNKSKRDSSLRKTSFSNKKHAAETSRKSSSKRDSTSRNLSQAKFVSVKDTEEPDTLDDSDDDIRAPFLLYTVKSKKSSTPKDDNKSLNKSKGKETVQPPSIVINSGSDTEKENASDLDIKIQSLIANQHEKDSSSGSSYESVTHYLDDLAEEGEEDTPSEGSNDIIERGESIGSTESEIDSDDTYENDSFIDDNDDNDLLSGEEYDLGQEKKKKQPKKRKHSRIITVSDSEAENKENELSAANKVDVVQPEQVNQSKEKVVNGIEEDSDLEKMSTQPYCGLTPPSIMSLRESLSDSDKIEAKEEVTSTVLINKEDNLQSLEQLKQHEISTDVLKASAEKRKPLTPKAAQTKLTVFTPNNSILEDTSAESNKAARKRHSSITIHENIKLQDVAEGNVSDRISKVVDVFCSSVKIDGKEPCGNISLNISLEYVKSPSASEENSEVDSKESQEQQLVDQSKDKMVANIEKVVENVLRKRLSSELSNVPQTNLEEIKLSAKKRKTPRKSLLEKSSFTDPEGGEGWETFSENNLSKNEDLANKKKLSKKDRKKKKKQKGVNSAELVSQEKTEKAEKILNDSGMSEDLDEQLNKKYTPDTSDDLAEPEEKEPEIIAKISSKKSKKKKPVVKQQIDNSENTISELVTKVKKRKRDKTGATQEENEPILKTKKQKNISKSEIEEVSIIPSKKTKKLKTSNESEPVSDDVFFGAPQEISIKKKKNKQSLPEETKPKEVVKTEPSHIKKKKLKPQAVPSLSKVLTGEESKFHYFPSRILNTLSKTEKMPGSSNPPKKPKLVPSSTMGKRSWDADVVDETVLPSTTSSKKFKMDVESFNKKDFKNLMLYDPSRVKRMDSKNLLKKKQKMKF